jgi:cell division septation protein DedD
VRIGRFAKRADATALVAKLKSEKTSAFLVEAERP